MQDSVVEDSFENFEINAKLSSNKKSMQSCELPFWRILYFKENDVIVWGKENQAQQFPCTPPKNSCSPYTDCLMQRPDFRALRSHSCHHASPSSDKESDKDGIFDSGSGSGGDEDISHMTIPWLPACIWQRILTFCGNREIAALEDVCSDLRDLISDSNMWTTQYKRTFGIHDDLEEIECRKRCLASEICRPHETDKRHEERKHAIRWSCSVHS